jgi:aminotransferase
MPMPPYVVERLRDTLRSGYAPYTNYYGYLELREKIAEHLRESYDIEADPEEEILVTIGVQEGLYIVMRSTLVPGDEVLMPSPHYAEYYLNAKACGCKPVLVPLDEDEGWVPDIDRMRDAITPRTRCIVFSNPNNPLGTVWSREVLEGIAGLAQEHDLMVLVDEIYHEFTYSGEPVSIASLPGMKERTFTFGGFSKAFMMMGLRTGFVVGPAEAMFEIKKLHYCVALCPPYTGEIAALAALECPKEQVEPMYAEFEGRLTMLYEGITEIPGVTCVRPGGSFYMFPDISAYGMSAMELALALIDEAGIVTLPGTEFGPYGEGHFRLSVCADREDLEKGLARWADFARGRS